MSDHNPYAPPKAEVRDPAPAFPGDLASRASRLGAAIVDSIIGVLMILPLFVFTDYFAHARAGTLSPLEQFGAPLLSFALFMVANGYFLTTAGQTIGKRWLEIRIVDAATGRVPPLARLIGLRYAVMEFMNLIPVVGSVLGLIDVLMIFRDDRRCLHDHLAGTKVVTAKGARG